MTEPILTDVPLGGLVVGACMEARHGTVFDAATRDAQLAALTDAELRLAWLSSSVRLRRRVAAGRASVLGAVVLERSWYLAEIERRSRSQAGFAAWVRGGGRPGAEPTSAAESQLLSWARRLRSRFGGQVEGSR